MRRLDRLTRRAVEIAFAAVLMCGWVQALSAQSGAPPELEEWRGWALRNDPWIACPWLAGEDAGSPLSRACAWPGVLTIVTVVDGASFSQRWRIGARSRVTLPGDAATWPQQVTVDGAAAPVVETDNGLPAVWLDEGEHAVSGLLRWQRRPQSLTLPFESPLLSLSIDGAEVSAIARDGNQVRLGRGDAVAQAPERVTLRVFRKLVDGVPVLLETRISLEVSGDAREATLHSPLPAGFAPTRVTGSLNARVDSRGDLVVQLRPGTHEIGLHARALAAAATHARPVAHDPWPAQEVWSFEQAPRWRIAQAAGGAQIDPAQAGVPAEWQALPAFLMDSGAAFRVEQRSRGPSADDRNRLRLVRSLWLDFDGTGYTTRDTVLGEIRRDWRLEVVAPFRLTRAVVNGEATQVTRGAQQGRSGIELRHAEASIDASARIEGAGSNLPVNGWVQTFDAVETTLQLPPGYRLWAAPGADRAGGSWLSRWTLLAVFYVAVASLLAF